MAFHGQTEETTAQERISSPDEDPASCVPEAHFAPFAGRTITALRWTEWQDCQGAGGFRWRWIRPRRAHNI